MLKVIEAGRLEFVGRDYNAIRRQAHIRPHWLSGELARCGVQYG